MILLVHGHHSQVKVASKKLVLDAVPAIHFAKLYLPIHSGLDLTSVAYGIPECLIHVDATDSTILIRSIRNRYLASIYYSYHLFFTILRLKPLIIYVYHSAIRYTSLLFLFRFLPGFKRIKFVLRVLGLNPRMLLHTEPSANILGKMFYRGLYARPWDKIIVTEDGSDKEIGRTIFQKSKVLFLFNGYNGARRLVHNGWQGVEDVITLSFVGRLEPSKGLDIVINALNRLAHLDITLNIYGEGTEMAMWKNSVKSLPGSVKVIFHGFQDNLVVWEGVSRSDLYISANRIGNFSNSNIEAVFNSPICIFMEQMHYNQVSSEIIPPGLFYKNNSDQDLARLIACVSANKVEYYDYTQTLRSRLDSMISEWSSRIELEANIIG